jgi:hypothetical protein
MRDTCQRLKGEPASEVLGSRRRRDGG